MSLRSLFRLDVTRDIPPVVYFHEQDPARVAAEVSEYIVTGGWPEGHPNHKRVPNGIHEQYVHLLTGIVEALGRAGGPDLPASWISGFYGSGKSSFAKLLGLALDGLALPDGTALAEAWLRRDASPRSAELREAWKALRARVDPLAVVFDIGGTARENEHIHAAIARQVQKRLGYCHYPVVADYELRLEREGVWPEFVSAAERALGRPWSVAKDGFLAEDEFSKVMHALRPDLFSDPSKWFTGRGGGESLQQASAEEVTRAIGDMLSFRAKGRTLFVVVDEVSQYIHQDNGRMLVLQSLVSELGQRLRGRVWLLVTGQEKLDDAGDQLVLGKMKDRFPPRLRVHLSATNIRDVVHRRLLEKTAEAEATLRRTFQEHRHALSLYAYVPESVTEEDFVQVYPLLPGHIDLLLQITSAMRTRSARAQGDDQAIRGLLQLLGELFRDQGLADAPLGTLVTLDRIYDVQHTALDSDVQATLARILKHCGDRGLDLALRAAKVVALLELIQETVPTTAELVARCLYDRLDRGDRVAAVTEALEALKAATLLGYSEKHGYKVQSSAGEEWQRERGDIGVPGEQLGELVREALQWHLSDTEKPRLHDRAFPFGARYTDTRTDDAVLVNPREDAAITVDLRFLPMAEQLASSWVRRSDESALRDRLVWVAGETGHVGDVGRELVRSRRMVDRYKARRESLGRDKQRLLLEEQGRMEDLETRLRAAVSEAWMVGRIYFRGREHSPKELGAAFSTALYEVAKRALPDLYPQHVPIRVQPSELAVLLAKDLVGPSRKFLSGPDGLGLLDLDAGNVVVTCQGQVPQRVLDLVKADGGVSGQTLLTKLGGPPTGHPPDVVKACVAALLRGGLIEIRTSTGRATSIRDADVAELFDKDRAFRQADIFPASPKVVGPKELARIGRFFEDALGLRVAREEVPVADAVEQVFPVKAARLRNVVDRFGRLPGRREVPQALVRLQSALEECRRRLRNTRETVVAVFHHLDALRDGLEQLAILDAELTDEVVERLREIADLHTWRGLPLLKVDGIDAARAAVERIGAHLAGERPWREVTALESDVDLVGTTYREVRTRLLGWQQQQAEAARATVRGQEGFATLTGEQTHHVLRPLTEALTDTTADAVAPPLDALKAPFLAALAEAKEESLARLDEIVQTRDERPIVKVKLEIRDRVVQDEAELDALLASIRERVLALLKDRKHRVRLQ